MDHTETLANESATDATAQEVENQAQAAKTYTQEEVDNMMARMRGSMERKFTKTFEDLGDIDELKRLKTEAEKRKQDEQIKRGEFEKTLQELAQKKDMEIQKRDSIIKEYKVNSPLLNAAAKYKSVNPEQVKALLANQVRLNEEGDVEVVKSDGTVRYTDSGTPFDVDSLVREFLDSNPHFVQPTAATANTKSNVGKNLGGDIDISKLDMKDPEQRKRYAELRNIRSRA